MSLRGCPPRDAHGGGTRISVPGARPRQQTLQVSRCGFCTLPALAAPQRGAEQAARAVLNGVAMSASRSAMYLYMKRGVLRCSNAASRTLCLPSGPFPSAVHHKCADEAAHLEPNPTE